MELQSTNEAVRVVPYEPRYRAAFKALNEEWITQYFQIEDADRKALDEPEANILNKGGEILVALLGGEPVGVCALVKMDDVTFELAKMAVTPRVQGRGIGFILGRAAIVAARERGAQRVYLESNTNLAPALALYRKLGFQSIPSRPSPYQRADIQMELRLE